MRTPTERQQLLVAAIAGYQHQITDMTRRVAELRRELGDSVQAGIEAVPDRRRGPARRKNQISEEGRARIAAAQRARWAALKKKGRAA
jgi:hypothetical protein